MDQHFDVVIMGGGIAGNLQARHLLRTIPGFRVAIVAPPSAAKIGAVHKIGESTVEIAAIFMSQELGLVDYLLENHPPKCGLAFHWAKQPGQTGSLQDYVSIWPPRFPKVMTWQLHRGKLERDLTEMNRADGVTWLRGKVKDFDIGEFDDVHHVHVKKVSADGFAGTLTCDHVVDAAGRAWLTGRKFDNIRQDEESLYGLNTGAAWVRVEGVDPELFDPESPRDRVATSQYYATNHWMGRGHWLWQIPIDTETKTLSVGGMFHHDVIPGDSVGTQDKLLAFIRANHSRLGQLIDSADEVVDFVYWKKPSFLPKQMFSADGWYTVGDAAYFGDAFYSFGISAAAIAVSSTTELIRSKMAGELDYDSKVRAYNSFNVYFGETNLHLYRDHVEHVGHASVMSWRIYLEYMWWFGMWVPMFIGRFHLDPVWCKAIVANCEKAFFKSVYDDMTRLIRTGGNAGFIDPYRSDQLLGGYHPTQEHGHFLENAEFESGRLNLYKSLGRTYRLTAAWLLKFQWKAFGWKGLLHSSTLWRALRMFGKGAYIGWGGSLLHLRNVWGKPSNRLFSRDQEQFELEYRYSPEVQRWDGAEDADESERHSAA